MLEKGYRNPQFNFRFFKFKICVFRNYIRVSKKHFYTFLLVKTKSSIKLFLLFYEPEGRSIDMLTIYQDLDDMFADLLGGDSVYQATQFRSLYRYGLAVGTYGKYETGHHCTFATRIINVESRIGIYR